MVQVQVLTPLNAHKPRSSSFHCSPLTRRRTLPSPRDLSFSQIKYQNAIERAAVRKLTAQLLASPSILALKPTTKSTVLAVSAPSFASASVSSASDNQIEIPPVPATPPTPLEVEDILPAPEPKSKVDIFKNTTKSSELLDLILAALDRIYIQDFCQDSSSLFHPKPQPMIDAVRPGFGRAFNQYEHSPAFSCGSSVSSASSTPSSIPTPRSMSPEIVPEIASPSGTTSAAVDYSKTGLKPVGRTQSLPGYTHPVLEDKSSLRWFLTELLRRSRASASVVQLALHYLTQARVPVGKILIQRFKSEPEVRTTFAGEDDKDNMKEADSPLLDPRRLLLASLMLSTKILHDHAPNNRAWARVCGLDAIEVGKCERALGQALNWELAHMFVGPVDKPLFE